MRLSGERGWIGECERSRGAGELTGVGGIRGQSMGVLQRSVPLKSRCGGGGMESGWSGSGGAGSGLGKKGRAIVGLVVVVVGCARRVGILGGWVGLWRCPGSGGGLGRLVWVSQGGCGRRRGGGGVDGSRRGIRGPSMGVLRRFVPLQRVSGGGAMELGGSSFCGRVAGS